MSHRLACESNGKIAAVAAVAGTIGAYLNCSPAAEIPVLHIHGTADGTVGYTGNSFGDDAEETFEFWETNNGCDIQAGPDTTYFPDIANDGYTVEHFRYQNCTNGVGTELLKINGADHVWLGPGNDVVYTPLIWKFFSRGTIQSSEEMEEVLAFQLSPVPATSFFNLEFQLKKPEALSLQLRDLQGRLLTSETLKGQSGNNRFEIEIGDLGAGLFVLELKGKDWSLRKRLVKVD